MEDRVDESHCPGTDEAKALDKTQYREKGKCICKISRGRLMGTGFFSKIDYKGKTIPVLITNYHVIDDDFINKNKKLTFYINGDLHEIDINKENVIYSSTDKKYDIMIIKLKGYEGYNFLEIDNNIFKDGSLETYKNQGIYILHYPGYKEKAQISFGKGIEKIREDNDDIMHKCHTDSGSSGSPILCMATNKVIAIHRGGNLHEGHNYATFLKFPLNELMNKNKNEIKVRNNYVIN